MDYFTDGEKSILTEKEKASFFPVVAMSTGVLDLKREELKRLRRDNKDLAEERDISKKAMSIFYKKD